MIDLNLINDCCDTLNEGRENIRITAQGPFKSLDRFCVIPRQHSD